MTGTAYPADGFTPLDPLAGIDQDALHVSVQGLSAIGVFNDHRPAIVAFPAPVDYYSSGRSQYRVAGLAGNIQPIMESVMAPAEIGCDFPNNRPSKNELRSTSRALISVDLPGAAIRYRQVFAYTQTIRFYSWVQSLDLLNAYTCQAGDVPHGFTGIYTVHPIAATRHNYSLTDGKQAVLIHLVGSHKDVDIYVIFLCNSP